MVAGAHREEERSGDKVECLVWRSEPGHARKGSACSCPPPSQNFQTVYRHAQDVCVCLFPFLENGEDWGENSIQSRAPAPPPLTVFPLILEFSPGME